MSHNHPKFFLTESVISRWLLLSNPRVFSTHRKYVLCVNLYRLYVMYLKLKLKQSFLYNKLIIIYMKINNSSTFFFFFK